MVGPSGRTDPGFHLQGGAVLGAVIGLIIGANLPRMVTLVLMGAAALAFAWWFRGSLWPLLSRSRLYESFFGIAGPGPVTYIREGAAAGIVLGGAIGIVLSHFSMLAVSLLLWAGLAVLVMRYMDSLRCLLTALQGVGSTRRAAPYRQLLAKIHGDRALAERLMAYEAKRAPIASRDELAERALERLERDRR